MAAAGVSGASITTPDIKINTLTAPKQRSKSSLLKEVLVKLRRQNGSYFFRLLESKDNGLQRALDYGEQFDGHLDASEYTRMNDLLKSDHFQAAINRASSERRSLLVTILEYMDGISPKDFLNIVVHSAHWHIDDADWNRLLDIADARGVWSVPFDCWKTVLNGLCKKVDHRIARLIERLKCGDLNPPVPTYYKMPVPNSDAKASGGDGDDNDGGNDGYTDDDGGNDGETDDDDGDDGDDGYDNDEGVTKDHKLYAGTVLGKILEIDRWTACIPRTVSAMLDRVWDIDFRCVSGSGDPWLALSKKRQKDLSVAVPLLLGSVLDCGDLITLVMKYALVGVY